MEPTMHSLPAFTLIGMELRVPPASPAIPNLWREFTGRSGEIPGVLHPERGYGVARNWDPATGTFGYLAAVEVEGGAQPPAGMVRAEIPAQTYAAFRTSLSHLGETLHEANHAWLPASGYRRADGPEFELYDKDFEPHNPDATMYFYLPVV
jgi:AraC family transcriptional regulator